MRVQREGDKYAHIQTKSRNHSFINAYDFCSLLKLMTLLFLPVPVGVNARIAVGTYSRKGLTICRQHTLKLLRSGRRRTYH